MAEKPIHKARSILLWATGGLLAIIGLILLVGGAWLLALGGSAYYALAGAAVLASGALYILRNRWADAVYAAMLVGTWLWSWWEASDNPWALMARLLAPAILGLWLALPWIRRQLPVSNPASWRSQTGIASVLILLFLVFRFTQFSESLNVPALPANANTAAIAANENWDHFGRDLSGQRFSPLTQINVQNVADLKVAWTHRSQVLVANNGLYEAVPLKVENSLYTCSPRFVIMALDARNGKERWRFDPKVKTDSFPFTACRGVAFYQKQAEAGICAKRIITTSPDAKLRALDAETGKPCADFGTGGAVSMLKHMGPVTPGHYFSTSPPTVVGQRIIVGSMVFDNQSRDMPSGVIRAFDANSGALLWAWDMGAPDRVGPPPAGEVYTRGTPNAWMVFAADAALNMVYVPLGNPGNDFYGATRRPFDEKFGSALVALDLTTGRARWSYQTTRHDLWDYDVPAQPVLTNIQRGTSSVPAVIQATKRGDIFVLDRRNGRPLLKVNEVRAPGGATDADHLSPTQPMSSLSVTPPRLQEANMWGATPIDMMVCRINFHRARYDGLFTPPGPETSLQYPGSQGTVDWGGVSVDADRGIMTVNSADFPYFVRMTKRDGKDVMPQIGAPYAVKTGPFLGPLRMPCAQPPWGFLTAFDLRNGKRLWQHPVGTARDTGPLGLSVGPPLPIGILNLGGTMTTRSGLIFLAGTLDNYIRAFDIRNGKELWRARLPAGAQTIPMTYSAEGRQYLVLTVGGHSHLGTKRGDYTIAFALPASDGKTASRH
jgi:quinoprotein glucose dehydrogenase